MVWGVKAHWTISKRAVLEDLPQAEPNEITIDQSEGALNILRALADGVDPLTGEIFSSDNPLQQPQIIRALFFAIRLIEKSQVQTPTVKQKKENASLKNAGKAWDADQDSLVCEQFDSGMKISEMARIHERTYGAIKSRLIRLGKIEDSEIAGLEDSRQELETLSEFEE